MFTEKSISRIFYVLFVIVCILAVTPLQAAHAAGVRYAKPGATGTGNCLSWANACTLQTALTGAVSGDEIWAAGGVYKPTAGTDRTTTFQLKDGVAVYGGFAGTEIARSQRNPTTHLTILSGDIGIVGNFSDNSYHVVTGATGATGATLDGFTITAGKANGTFLNEFGGGMYNYSSSPTLTNITFSGNSASYGGGMYNANSSPALTNVTFSGNSAGYGGGMYNANSSPVLTNATFNGNGAYYNGGGMGNDQSFPSLTNVLFNGNSANYGGGMYNDASSPALTNVTFINNSAASGGGMYNANSSPMLTDVSFSGNSATGQSPQGFGGGMYNESGSSPTMTNVTFSNNSAGVKGGGMYNDTSNPTLTDVSFSGNSAQFGGGMDNENSSSPILTNVTFSGNSAVAYDGGGMENWNSSSPTLTNVTFRGNSSAYRGGGMFNGMSCSPTLTNVTFGGNSAEYGGGMYNYYSSSPQIRNTIFWGNTSATAGAQIYTEESSTPSVSDSVVQDGYGGGTNIIPTDPKLGPLGNYGGFTQTIPLQAGSSAIDTGNDSVCPATDQRGISRPQGAHCDIGAYEVDTTAPMVNSISRFNPSPTNLASVDFTLTFSEDVTGVAASDFALTKTGTISGASVTGVSGGPITYTVSVSTGSGNGTIRLDVPAGATIADLAGNPLAGLPYTGGETYTITKVFTIFLPLILR